MTMGHNDDTAEFHLTHDDIVRNSILSTYITKAPPKEKMKNSIHRWCMRWFVLYYKRASRACWLFYYKNEDAFQNGKLPKGRIDLKHSKIRAHSGGGMNKYEYIIDVITVKRTYFLCFTSHKIFSTWLTKLDEVHKDVWSIEAQDVNNDKNNNDTMNDDEKKESEKEVRDQITSAHQVDNEAPAENTPFLRPPELRGGGSSFSSSPSYDVLPCRNRNSVDFSLLCNTSVTIHRDKKDTPSELLAIKGFSTPQMTPRNPKRASTVPKLGSIALTKGYEHHGSLQSLSGHPQSPARVNVRLVMLERLKEAASRRSFDRDYDMGDFTGPTYNYPHSP